jgi:hypothetical protein
MSRTRERTLKRAKSDRGGGTFLPIPTRVLVSLALATLSAYATKLLLDLCSQYRYGHNGDLCGAWTLMRVRGWKSKETLNNARKELLASGLIVLTRQGSLHKSSLFAVGWLAIDECGGKLDLKATSRPLNDWMDSEPPLKIKSTSTPSVPKPIEIPNIGTAAVQENTNDHSFKYG